MPTPHTAFTSPGPGQVYVPAADGRLQVEFSRNPATFPLMRYCQIVPVGKLQGFYPVIDTNTAIRVVNQQDFLWPDGQPRPLGDPRPLKWKSWSARRYAYPFPLGNLTIEQADYDIVASHARGVATQCMTARTLEAITDLTTAGNWATNHTHATLDALGVSSGSWLSSSTSQNYIKASFNLVKQQINKSTGGVIGASDLQCLVNPQLASDMGETAEIIQYMVQHEQAMSILKGMDREYVDAYGLPPQLYGIMMTVEDAVRESARRESDDTGTSVDYILGDTKSVFVSRPGGMLGNPGTVDTNGNAFVGPSMSTITGLFIEEMQVEIKVDDWNRLTLGSVVETRDFQITASESGMYLQDVST